MALRTGSDSRMMTTAMISALKAIMASETTAAAAGQVGVVRRDPMAMLPFCGYNMGDYFGHWLEMGKKLGDKAPLIFNVNWFRTNEAGEFVWPGFGENTRVLKYILDCVKSKAHRVDTPIGLMPDVNDIELEGSGLTKEDLDFLLTIDNNLWKEEADGIEAFYDKFNGTIPKELMDELANLRSKLG